jgi:endonuclease/exonuclease/phosphatase family metal-dependent hydrolase
VITWNLFHGRDFPPDPALFTWRSRLLRITERNATHVQLNRDLFREFALVLRSLPWDVALLQECPPRWHAALARACDAEAHAVLTSRNSLPRLRACAAHLNPDLIASNEGGSNLTLVRRIAGPITHRAELVLTPGPHPERRALCFIRLGDDTCIANAHLSAGAANRARAEDELRRAAQACVAWAGSSPLILGGDLNIRPRSSPIYAELEHRFGLVGATAPDALDHLLARGLTPAEPPRALPPEARELVNPRGLRLRLSDHAPVLAAFARA